MAAVPGGHVALGTTAPSTTWYFAEGYTGAGFQQYLTLANPGAQPAVVEIRYLLSDDGDVTGSVDVAPASRSTVDVNAAIGPGHEVAMALRADRPVVAERPIYFDAVVGAAGRITGGDVAVGATEPSATWLFAEGYTGPGFQEYITIANPGEEAVSVTLGGGSLEVAVGKRATVDVNALLGSGRETPLVLTATAGVVAERVMYFSAPTNGGHTSLGAVAPSATWLFAEGYTGAGHQEYLTIFNPGPSAAAVGIEFSATSSRLDVPAGVRRTVDVNAVVGAGVETGAIVRSSAPVVVERPSYFRRGCGLAGCELDGGHVGLGATAATRRWHFAEGYTGDGFRTYLTLLNPGGDPANADLRLLVEGHDIVTAPVLVGSHARVTLDLAQLIGPDRSVATDVSASQPIVVERPEYFSGPRRDTWRPIGTSVTGRAIEVAEIGDGPEHVLVVGGIHGDEPEGLGLAERLRDELLADPSRVDGRTVAIIRDLNPDGTALAIRNNARGVDLNRNFPARDWQPSELHGPAPLSEPEASVLAGVVDRFRPARTVVFHSTIGPPLVIHHGGPEGLRLAHLMSSRNGFPVADSIGYPAPGSFGSWADELALPTITLEQAGGTSDDAAWSQQRSALLEFVGG